MADAIGPAAGSCGIAGLLADIPGTAVACSWRLRHSNGMPIARTSATVVPVATQVHVRWACLSYLLNPDARPVIPSGRPHCRQGTQCQRQGRRGAPVLHRATGRRMRRTRPQCAACRINLDRRGQAEGRLNRQEIVSQRSRDLPAGGDESLENTS